MKTELAFEVMCNVLPDVAEIINDPELEKAQKNAKALKKTFKQAMTELLPFFLNKHRGAVLNIFAAVQGKTLEEVKEQPFTETTIVTVTKAMEEIMLFFAFCLRMAMHA